jgi:hypothetical protein
MFAPFAVLVVFTLLLVSQLTFQTMEQTALLCTRTSMRLTFADNTTSG